MINIPLTFFRDEVRNGFYISTQIKQAWGAQLMVLSAIDDICRKHDITYFADWGTLLGAVRHGGYIPWDDDLDICMKRADYIKFRQAAKAELPEGFAVQDYANQKDHWFFIAKVVNRNHMCFEEKHLNKYNNFPYIACVDIFVLDYLYRDEKKEKERCDEIMRLLSAAEGILEGRLSAAARENCIARIERDYHIRIGRDFDARQTGIVLYKLAEEQMSRVKDPEADRVGQIFPWILKGGKGYPKEYFDKAVRLPFECAGMPVPYRYNEVARRHYGDYLKVKKGRAAHEYPFYEGQRAKLQEIADFKLPEFSFSQGMLWERNAQDTVSLKSISKECLARLERLHEDLRKCILYDIERAAQVLQECQELAVEIGTLIERTKGEGNPAVKSLEDYCEALFGVYEAAAKAPKADEQQGEAWPERLRLLGASFDRVKEAVCQYVTDRRTILFLPVAHERWSGFNSLYEAAVRDESCDVYVIPLPLYRKNPYGELTGERLYDPEEYPEKLPLRSFEDFDIGLHHADIIYIQDVYDDENPLLSVPQGYYTSALKKNCESLVYVPPFELAEFGEEDRCEEYNVSKLMRTPGIMNADMVYAQSGAMRERCIKLLTDFAGRDTKEIWEKKIVSIGLPVQSEREKHMKGAACGKKDILYCIGANELTENDCLDSMLEAVEKRLEVFKTAGMSGLSVTLRLYPPDISVWERISSAGTQRLLELIAKYAPSGWCRVDSASDMGELASRCDAYYGEPSPMVLLFLEQGKPVMIAMKPGEA